MSEIPIIVVHQNGPPLGSPHVNICLESGIEYGNKVIHIGTEIINHNAEFVHLESLYSDDIETLSRNYSHHTRENPEWEKFCFARWFYIRELATRRGLERIVCVDSDVVIMSNTKEWLLSDADIIACLAHNVNVWTLGQCVLRTETLVRLCKHILHHGEYGTDMNAVTDFLDKNRDVTITDATVIRDRPILDHHIEVAEPEFVGVPVEGSDTRRIKRLTFNKGECFAYPINTPGKQIRLLNVHCWGDHKMRTVDIINKARASRES